MNNFPLTPFLLVLMTDGILVGPDDYARIILVLQTGGRWNLSRLRGVLLALLVRNEREEELFLRRFQQFFAEELPEDDLDIDVELVLCKIRAALEQKSDYETAAPPAATTAPLLTLYTRTPAPSWSRLKLSRVSYAAILVLLLIIVLLGEG